MVWFFCFRVTNLKLKNKKIYFELLTQWGTFTFTLSSYERKVYKWKKSHQYYSSNVHEPLEIDTIPYISKNLL